MAATRAPETPTAQEAPRAPETPTSRAGRRSTRILVNAGFRAVADVGSKIATAALYIFVARKLGASELGVYAFALSFVGVVTAIGQFGQDIVLTREVAHDPANLEEYYSNAITSRVIFSIPPLAIATLVALAAGMSHHTLLVVAILGLGFVGDYMVQIPFAVFQAYERLSLVAVVLIAQRWITTSLAIAALYLGGGLALVAAIYCGGSLMATGLGTLMMYRYVARPRLHVDLRGALRVTREAFPIGIALVALTILFRIDMAMLAMFKPARVVGEYGAAYKLLETTAFFSWAVNIAVLPSLSRLSASTVPSVGEVYQRGLKLVIAITLPVAVGAIVLAGPIISLLYGEQYRAAATALALLAPTIALFPISSLSSQLFFAQQRRPTVALVYAIVAAENVLANLVLIPLFSLNGAAADTAISELLVAGLLIVLAGQLRGRLQLRRMLSGPVLGSACAAGALLALRAQPLAAAFVAGAAYLAVLLGYERLCFPADFSVVQALVAQVRSKLSRSEVSGELS